jgi:hypothetical protein
VAGELETIFGQLVEAALPPRGDVRQYRLTRSAQFRCIRCGRPKTARLIALLRDDTEHPLCNACYGNILSRHPAPRGSDRTDSYADAMAVEVEVSIRRAMAVGRRLAAEHGLRLTELGERHLGTARIVADHLGSLDDTLPVLWSPVVSALSSTVEVELRHRLIDRMRDVLLARSALIGDLPGEYTKFVAYCKAKPGSGRMEMGAMARFLASVAIDSRQATPTQVGRDFRKLLETSPKAEWLGDPNGLATEITAYAREFRNPAAHGEEIGRDVGRRCLAYVAGDDGLLWRVVYAVPARVTP